jgi:hypothetical protein
MLHSVFVTVGRKLEAGQKRELRKMEEEDVTGVKL